MHACTGCTPSVEKHRWSTIKMSRRSTKSRAFFKTMSWAFSRFSHSFTFFTFIWSAVINTVLVIMIPMVFIHIDIKYSAFTNILSILRPIWEFSTSVTFVSNKVMWWYKIIIDRVLPECYINKGNHNSYNNQGRFTHSLIFLKQKSKNSGILK